MFKKIICILFLMLMMTSCAFADIVFPDETYSDSKSISEVFGKVEERSEGHGMSSTRTYAYWDYKTLVIGLAVLLALILIIGFILCKLTRNSKRGSLIRRIIIIGLLIFYISFSLLMIISAIKINSESNAGKQQLVDFESNSYLAQYFGEKRSKTIAISLIDTINQLNENNEANITVIVKGLEEERYSSEEPISDYEQLQELASIIRNTNKNFKIYSIGEYNNIGIYSPIILEAFEY